MKFQPGIVAIACMAWCWVSAVVMAVEHPNIVVVMADDLGYGDVRALNPESRIPTPHLDRLAADGMRFTDAHSPSSVCTPTRYGLLMGRYAWRTRLTSGVLDGYGAPLIEQERETIAEALKAAGYQTGIVGKWHLGLEFGRDASGDIDYRAPLFDGAHSHGFDFSYIIPASLDFPPYVYIRDGRITATVTETQEAIKFPRFVREGPIAEDFEMEACLDRLTDEAVSYIESVAGNDAPFFLYFPLTAPHKPVWPAERFRDATELGPYGDFVAQVDDTVGRVMEALQRADVVEETLVIFTSDNGSFMYRQDAADALDHVDEETIQAYRADRHRANHVYRGTKADIWEAGHRVPLFVRWPGRVATGTENTKTIAHTDIFATVLEAAGAGIADDAAEDSFSFIDAMTGSESNAVRPPVVNHSANGTFAIRDGIWKLVFSSGSGGREQPRGEPFDGGLALFRLDTDPEEAENLAEQQPERVTAMTAALERIRSGDYGE